MLFHAKSVEGGQYEAQYWAVHRPVQFSGAKVRTSPSLANTQYKVKVGENCTKTYFLCVFLSSKVGILLLRIVPFSPHGRSFRTLHSRN